MERVVLTLFQLFLPLSAEEAQERLWGAVAPSETPQALRGAVEGRVSSQRVTWAAQKGLGAFRGRMRAPLLFFVLS